jgi:hypothetical protein
VFTAQLHRNGSYFTVACVFVAAGIGLPSRCLAMIACSHFTIPAFGRHVTVLFTAHKIAADVGVCNVILNEKEQMLLFLCYELDSSCQK